MTSTPQLTEVSQLTDQPPEAASHRRSGGILSGLVKRKVCRTAISYMLVMWLNLQIGDVIFPMIGLPDWALSLIIVIGVMGFPVVLILAWAFQITPQGIVLDSGAPPNESTTEWQLDTVVNLLLLLSSIVLSVLLLLQFSTDGRTLTISPDPTVVDPTAIVVSSLSFAAATDQPGNLVLANGVQEELRHRLINLHGIEVRPDHVEFNTETRDRHLSLSGSLLLDGDTAHVLAHLIDLSAGRYLMSVAFNLEVKSMLSAETLTAERIIDEVEKTLWVADDPSA